MLPLQGGDLSAFTAQACLSGAAQKRLDAWAAERGLPGLLLMEEAGAAVYRYLSETCDLTAYAWHIFAGPGNNGGDGYVLSRLLLAAGAEVQIWEMTPDKAEVAELQGSDAGIMRRSCRACGLEPGTWSEFKNSALYAAAGVGVAASVAVANAGARKPLYVIEAILGSAFSLERPAPLYLNEFTAWLSGLREREAALRVLSVDIPAGVASNAMVSPCAVRADVTLSFVYPKSGIVSYPGRAYAGEIVVANIGFSPSMLAEFWQRESELEAPLYYLHNLRLPRLWPEPDGESHKGSFGHAYMCIGSEGMAGAGLMAAAACRACGAGLISAWTVADILPLCLQAMPSVMWRALCSDTEPECRRERWLGLGADLQAMLVGPGLGNYGLNNIMDLLLSLAPLDLDLVLDADALNALAADASAAEYFYAQRRKSGRHTVMTPHPGEFKRLAPDLTTEAIYARTEAARAYAQRSGCLVVLKGAGTVIADTDGFTAVNGSGNRGLAKGGSGDVLAGMILALLCRGASVRSACLAAVYVHGLAADDLAAATSFVAVTPELIIKKLAESAYFDSFSDNVRDA